MKNGEIYGISQQQLLYNSASYVFQHPFFSSCFALVSFAEANLAERHIGNQSPEINSELKELRDKSSHVYT